MRVRLDSATQPDHWPKLVTRLTTCTHACNNNMLIILASREGSLPGRAAAGSKVEGDDRMTLETGGWANISTFPSFFCFFSFLPDLLFFSIFSPLFLSGLCCSSPLWKGMELLVTGWESNLLFTVETGLLARGRTSRRCFNGGQESVRLPCCHYYCCSERKDLATTIAALRYWCYSN